MTGDSAARPPSKGAGLKLSREMKLVLATLLLLALLGGWFVWTGNRSADELAGAATPQTDPATAEGAQTGAAPTPAAGTPATPETAADGAADASGTPVEVAPSGQVEVPVIPAFGTLDDPDADPQTEAIPAPGGINPDTALAALPSVNPFRPLALEGEGQTLDGQSAATPVTPPAAPVAQAPAVSAATGSDRASTSSGPLALSPLPGTGASSSAAPEPVAVPSPRVTGGAFPTPTLPGANVPAPVAVKPSPRPASPAKPSNVRVTRPAAVPPASRPTAPAPVRVLPAPTPVRPPAAPTVSPVPARPPVAGVSVPPQSLDLQGTLGAAPAQPGGQPGTATSASGAAPTALPTPGTPQPITQLGVGGVEGSAAGPLGTLVQTRELAFDAVVLGPVNTAIFRSKDGFVVVSQGQTLPDSDVVVREISAERVTLELGPETQILELDPANSIQGEP